MSLRVRLTAISVLLVALGLLGAGIATRHYLDSFLIDRVDQQFASAQFPSLQALLSDDPQGTRGLANALPSGSYVALVTPGGGAVRTLYVGNGTHEAPGFLASAGRGISTINDYRVESVDAATVAGPGTPEGSARLVIAIPLDDVHSTVQRLTMIELLVGAIALVAVAVLALILVRVGLRPLGRIEQTAGAIAAGDLTQRVENSDPRTEVGRLGAALNEMLTQIEQAFAERERSENRLRRFVADASHELRTPLTSVRGYAELFRRGASERPEDLDVVMRRIEDDATRMGLLVDDMLLLARLDQGRPLERDLVDLGAIAADLVDEARVLHPQWPVELTMQGDAAVVGDAPRLRQAVGNLLVNARAHCSEGTPVAVAVHGDEDVVTLDVTDEGPGIAADDLPRVFERFYRADPSRSRASGGSGLGLSIVASIAEAHGGTATVASEPGRGATFRLTLPSAGSACKTADADADLSNGGSTTQATAFRQA
jgi:two-component system OmpR family sensor kinase